MLTLIILALLIYGFLKGKKRGSALQLFYTISYGVSYVIAALTYQGIGKSLELWIPYPSPTAETQMLFFDQETSFKLDKAFYAGLGFIIVLFICFLLIQIIGLFVKRLGNIRLFGTWNRLVSAILGSFSFYMGIFFLLTLGSMVPTNGVQNWLNKDLLADAMIERTIFFSGDIHRLWVDNVIGESK